MKQWIITAAAFVALQAIAAPSEHAGHNHGAADASQPAATTVSPADAKRGGLQDAAKYFTDLELQTQDGRKVKFFSDVLQGRTVLINVIYTNCKDACPLITQQLLGVRQALPADMFGKQVHFVSISSDPVRDTPAALKLFAKKQGADVEGWTFLTGRKENIDHILKKLGQYSETVEGHSTLFIAGNVPAKRWSKIRPNAPAPAIAMRLSELASPILGAAEAPSTRP